MKMSSDFAQTVAAVAPIVWLVGAVEVQQLAKRLATWLQEAERRYAEAEAAMSSAVDAHTLATARQLHANASKSRPLWQLWALYAAWAGVTGPLASSTILSIAWLAEMKESEQEFVAGIGLAKFCLWSIGAGITWVTVFPVFVFTHRGFTAMERHAQMKRSIAVLENVASLRTQENSVDQGGRSEENQ
ncbi:hypothetical protein [Streptomyces sp. DG1A-41]|uniref:hypothetical protein n=1 Tax=Streptomyces sp. DG1A-41 TaxID=3125779 RepID=UPI0030CD0D12